MVDYDYQDEFQQWRKNKLNDLKYHRAICMMICGHSLDDVANELGMSKRNVQRFFQDPDFQENLTRAIQLTFKNALSKAALYTDKAIDILIEISQNIDQHPKYRIQAIRELFNIQLQAGLHGSSKTDLEERLHTETKLLSHYNTVRSLNGDLKTGLNGAKMNIENERAIWYTLYPNEPFPDEETYELHFRKTELLDE